MRINTLKLKQKFTMIWYIQIFNIIKYQKMMSIVHSIFVNSNKEHYPQIFLEEYKCAIKDKKIRNTINEDLKLNKSDDESYE